MQGHNRGETISPEYSDKTNSRSGWSAADTLKVSDTPEKSGDDMIFSCSVYYVRITAP